MGKKDRFIDIDFTDKHYVNSDIVSVESVFAYDKKEDALSASILTYINGEESSGESADFTRRQMEQLFFWMKDILFPEKEQD